MRPGATLRTATSLHGAVAWRMPSGPGAGGSVAPPAAPVTALAMAMVLTAQTT
jgi:hypothetical protein